MAEESKIEQVPSTSSTQTPGDDLVVLRQTLAEKENRLKQLETDIENANAKLNTHVTEMADRDKEVSDLRGKLGGAAAKYRQIVLSGSPEVPEELVKGETVEEVEASFANARQMVERVKQGLEGKQQRERVPTGAPPRSPLDVSAMSPQEKIVYALRKGG